MNFRAVARVLASLVGVEGLFMVPSLIMAYLHGGPALRAMSISVATCLVIFLVFRKTPIKDSHLTPKDGLLVVVAGWVLASLIGALPLYLGGAVPTYTDSFFETVSGFTTTGASVIDDIEQVAPPLVFWRSMVHWLGGMGILVFTLALLPRLSGQGFKIFKAETTGPFKGKVEPKMKDTARRLYIIYLGISLALFLLLMVQGMGVFDSLVHTFGTVGTGGFSSNADSLAGYQDHPSIIITIGIFLIICSCNFSLYFLIFQKKWKDIFKDEELRVFLSVVFLAVLIIGLDLSLGLGQKVTTAFRDAFFQVTSLVSTAGFYSVDFDTWPRFSKYILYLLMFMGSCAGSTAGGIKVIRLILLFKLVKREILKVSHPKAIAPIRLNGRTVSDETLMTITGFFGVYFLLFIFSTGLVALADLDLISASSAVVTCLSNVGPGFEALGPTMNFAFFSPFYKVFFALLMLLGRLEFFTVFALVIPARLVHS